MIIMDINYDNYKNIYALILSMVWSKNLIE